MTTTSETTRKYEVLNWANGTPTKAEFKDWDDAIKYATSEAKANKEAGIAGAAAFNAIEIRTYEYTSESLGYLFGMEQDEPEQAEEPKVVEDEAPKPKGLSKAMQEALDGMMWKYNKAQGTTFETWYMGHPKHYQTWLNEHTERFGERITNNIIERQRKTYEDAVNGIVVTGANFGTLTALERRGIIEILTPSSNGHRVKLLNV